MRPPRALPAGRLDDHLRVTCSHTGPRRFGTVNFKVAIEPLLGQHHLAPAQRLELAVVEAVALPHRVGLVRREDGGQLAARVARVARDRLRHQASGHERNRDERPPAGRREVAAQVLPGVDLAVVNHVVDLALGGRALADHRQRLGAVVNVGTAAAG